MTKRHLLSAVLFLTFGLALVPTKAHATWGELYCDILNAAADDRGEALVTAVTGYNRANAGDRICKKAIRFKKAGDVTLNQRLTFNRMPPAGQEKGTSIRKCGQSESGCPEDVYSSNTSVILDFSGYTANEGDCPIRISSGAELKIWNVKIIAPNPNKVICDTSDNQIEFEDEDSPHAYVHNVTIEGAPDDDDDDEECGSGKGQTPCGGNIDADNDGVVNGNDECDDTPPNTPVDGHGCPIEADADGDGIPDEDDECDDVDGPDSNNGCPVEPADTDADDDGVPDGIDQCDETAPGTQVNSVGCPDQDGDNIADTEDKCDLDSTDDACDSSNLSACFSNPADNVCAGVAVGDDFACSEGEDMDADGRGNACDQDIDGDSLANGSDPDPFDKDLDNDEVNDNVDPCPTLQYVVPNEAGACAPEPEQVIVEVPVEVPGPTVEVPGPERIVEVPVEGENPDPDGDGLMNFLETAIGTDPGDPDSDDDGYNDGSDCFPLDASKQTCGEPIVINDPDTDDDTICDQAESNTDPVTGEPCTPNSLGQGDNCPFPNTDQADSDGNGVGDACEFAGSVSPDEDGDGLSDDLERVFHTLPNEPDTDHDGCTDLEEVNGITYQGGMGPLDPDVDADGICDCGEEVLDEDGVVICTDNDGEGDNCPVVKNEDQADADENGIGDACQDDMDGDTVLDTKDNCPFMANKDQQDGDEDGIGNSCDPDFSQSVADGCGCRIDGRLAGGPADAMPFLILMAPILLFRAARRKKVMVS